MIFWESDLNFVTVLLDAINLGHLLLQKPNGAGDRRVHAATIVLVYIRRAVLRRQTPCFTVETHELLDLYGSIKFSFFKFFYLFL